MKNNYNTTYYQKNKKKMLESQKKWNEKNRERINKYYRENYRNCLLHVAIVERIERNFPNISKSKAIENLLDNYERGNNGK